ncbi:hypothetical protein [Fusobacterium sp.]|uniref:hypothetical protein n=1 Tax=Fusobacterium sp. TaxID=68766 RepID=UPI00260EDDE2|nr:hypothetical protein [Fusobacterium sp.]
MKKVVNGLMFIVILIGVVIFGLKDIAIQKVLEKELSASLESKVRIYGVDYYIFKEKLELKGIGIENKDDTSLDAIYINRVTTNIKLKDIFNKKISLQNLEIKDIEIDKKTKRKNTNISNQQVEETAMVVNERKISQEDMQRISQSLVNDYQNFLQNLGSDNIEKNKRIKSIFIGATIPMLDKYIDYKLSDIATGYMNDIVKKYDSMKNNFKETQSNMKEDDWVVEISDLTVKTGLLGRKLEGVVKGITTDKVKMNKDIPFKLTSVAGEENSLIEGVLNIATFKGEIDAKFENVDVNSFMEIKDLISAKANLVQKIVLDEEKISVIGRLDIPQMDINKENVSEYFLKDRDALNVIVGDANEPIRDLKVEYNYNPSFNRVFVNSNIAKKVALYLGEDSSEFEKMKNDFKDKYGEKINQKKEELKYKLEEFINVFKKN